MKVTYNWLKTYAEFDLSPDDLVQTLTMLGFEVDAVSSLSWDFDGVVVGRVTRKVRHQNAEKLWVCDVDIGGEHLSVVCGAPNVEVGQKVPVAKAGTRLPDGRVIESAMIRGVRSEGMICSEAELGISSRGQGIMVLDEDVEFGKRLQDALGRGDVVLDIDVTPNRPDCFGVIGVAREIAAACRIPLRKPEVRLKEAAGQTSEYIQVNILDAQKCPRYTARYISGVKIGPSPWRLAHRLEAVGIRSINNVVDVTNYVMMETGQPLHAFDYDLLAGDEINVKCAAEGERFTTLDGVTRTLNSECLLICDARQPVAIGGVMGGENSEVTEKTANVLLESAYFDPTNIRRTAKALGIVTEASRRFERGVDPNGAPYALHRAAQLIAELTGGTVSSGFVDAYPSRIEDARVTLRPQRVANVLGVTVPVPKIEDILRKLEFQVSTKDQALQVEVPTFRPDVTREADLIEEVARHFGYDHIPAETSVVIKQAETRNLAEVFQNRVRRTLIGFGFSEVLTYNLIGQNSAEVFAEGKQLVQLLNPLSEEMSTLRPSILPSLLASVRWNINRKNRDLKFFEIGGTFHKQGKAVEERVRVAGVLTGKVQESSWQTQPREVTFYDLKGVVTQLLERSDVHDWRFIASDSNAFLGEKSLVVAGNGTTLGYLGEVKSHTLNSFDIEQPVFAFEFDFQALVERVRWDKVVSPIPKFPPVSRDLAVVVKADVEAERIRDEILAHGGPHLQDVRLFDVFTGKQVGKGLKSLAYNLTFYSLERTLTEQEIDAQIETILSALGKKFSAQLRS